MTDNNYIDLDKSFALKTENESCSDNSCSLLLTEDPKDILVQSNPKTIHTFSLFPLIVNATVGTGIFGLPYAYYEAGVYPSLAILLIFFVVNIFTSVYVLEAISRVNVIEKLENASGDDSIDNSIDCEIVNTYGYTELGNWLGGKFLKYFSNICLVGNCYGSLWGYVATCVTTISSIVWIIIGNEEKCADENHFQQPVECQLTYYGAICLYGLVVIPLSFLDVGRQAFIQLIMTIIRFGSFSLMLVTCFIQLGVNGPLSSERNVFSFQWDGFGTVFTHTAFAFVVQHNIPNLIAPVRGNKKRIHLPISIGLAVSSVFYILIGIVCCYTFNDSVQTPVTLNWSTYTGRNGGWGEGSVLWYAVIIKYIILIFPVINLTSSFPILSSTLSHNLEPLFPNKFRKRRPTLTKYLSKALAIFPPFLLTAIVSSLHIIFDIAGIIAFFLAFTLPCLYLLFSLYKFNRFNFISTHPSTPYTNFIISRPIFVILVMVFTFLLFGISFFFLFQEILEAF
ncbi:Amino acid transporter transmembrane domain-containing protein [Entamoeba marina]